METDVDILRAMIARTGLRSELTFHLLARFAADPTTRNSLLVAPLPTLQSLPTLSIEEKRALRRLGADGLRSLTTILARGSPTFSTVDTLVGRKSAPEPRTPQGHAGEGVVNTGRTGIPIGEVSLTSAAFAIGQVAQLPTLPFAEPWAQFDQQAIAETGDMNQGAEQPWLTGRTTDVLATTDGALYIASDGGLWTVDEWADAIPLPDTRGLSDTTDLGPSGFNTLLEDPGVPGRVYAAGASLVVNDGILPNGAACWRALSIPALSAPIAWMDVTGSRKLVLATTTGIYWAALPPPTETGAFQLDWSAPASATTRFTTVAAFGDSFVTADRSGNVLRGTWQPNLVLSLIVNFQNIEPNPPPQISQYIPETVVGKDAIASNVAYAICRASTYVLSTSNAGATWQPISRLANSTTKAFVDPGATDAYRPMRIAGVNQQWVLCGNVWLYISNDGGATWSAPIEQTEANVDSPPDAHIHTDINSIRVMWRGDQYNIFVCSDGGLASSPLSTPLAWTSSYNRTLLNLQMHAPSGAYILPGSIGVSQALSGAVAAGTQDNGVQYIVVGPGGGATWRPLPTEGDGMYAVILGTGHILYGADFGSPQPPWVVVEGTISEKPIDGNVLLSFDRSNVNLPAGIVGVGPAVMDVVARPRSWFYDMQDFMWGLVAGFPQNAGGIPGQPVVFGVFAGQTGALRMIPVAAMSGSSQICAVFSADGNRIFIGTRDGGIFRLDRGVVRTSDPLPAPVQEPIGGDVQLAPDEAVVARFAETTNGNVFAAYTGDPSRVLARWVTAQGGQWLPTDNGMFAGSGLEAQSLCAGADNVLFVSFTKGVYALDNTTGLWYSASSGLPLWPQCSDIRFARDPVNGAPYLYLGTFGRGLWRATQRA
jgi:hypothetical protein